MWVRLPAIDRTPVVALNAPPLIANGPFTVIAAEPPLKLAPAWLNPVAPIVAAADWVMAPAYVAAIVRPLIEIAALIVAGLALVPSNDATSAAPGTTLPDQFAASVQLFVGPRPVQVRVTPSAGLLPTPSARAAASSTAWATGRTLANRLADRVGWTVDIVGEAVDAGRMRPRALTSRRASQGGGRRPHAGALVDRCCSSDYVVWMISVYGV